MAQIIRQTAHILARQVAADGGNEGTIQVPIRGTPGHCDAGNEYNGDLGLRISAIFVILVGSLFGKYMLSLTRETS
jgi:zinc transporter 1/2/3